LGNWIKDFFIGEQPKTAVPNVRADQRSVLASTMDDADIYLKKLGLENLRVHVNAKNAMGIATFYSCVSYLSRVIACLPYNVIRSKENGGIERVREHPLDYILETRFNKNMTPFNAKRAMILNYLVHGWAIAEVKRDRSRKPYEIIPYPCNKVNILHDELSDEYFFDITHAKKRLSQDDVIFLKDLSFDGATGGSIIDWQAQTIKIDLFAKGFTEKYFEKGTFMGGIIEHPQMANVKNEDDAKAIKKSFVDAFGSNGDGGFGVAVLAPGVKFHPVGLPPNQSQLLEIFNMSKKDIALMFGVPLSILGDTEVQSSWGSGVEQMYINLINNVLAPIVIQVEQEFDYKCFSRAEIKGGHYTKHNFRGLLRGDMKAQAEFWAKMVSNGIYTPDEARYYDEKEPLPNGVGAKAYMNGTMNPLDMMDEIKGAKYGKNDTRKKGTSSES
jgi:HK97 family phage portal protein